MQFVLIIISILTVSGAQASLTKFDVFNSKKLYYDYSAVCTDALGRVAEIIDVVDSKTLNCMGTEVNAAQFCDKKYYTEKGYMRGYLDKQAQKLVCQHASRVVMSFKCPKNSKQAYCTDALNGCKIFQNLLAKNLDLFHHSLIKRDDETKDLNCYFENNLSLESLE